MTPEQSEAIRTMDNTQFIYFTMITIVAFILSTAAIYFITYFKKNAELKSINDHLDTVIKKTKQIEKDVDFIADQQSELTKEKRKSLFDLHYALSDWLHHLSAVVPDLPAAGNEFQETANTKYSYILLTRSRYSLLFPSIGEIDVPLTEFVLKGIEFQKLTAVLQDKLTTPGANHQQLLNQYGLDRTLFVETMYLEMSKLDVAFRKLIEHTKKLRA